MRLNRFFNLGNITAFTVFSMCILFSASCSKHVDLSNFQVTVNLGECSKKMGSISICLDSVLTDSRCPEGAVCIWQGTAIVKITLIESGNKHQFNMALKEYPSLGNSSDTIIGRHRIVFTSLKPLPSIKISLPPVRKPGATFEISQVP